MTLLWLGRVNMLTLHNGRVYKNIAMNHHYFQWRCCIFIIQ